MARALAYVFDAYGTLMPLKLRCRFRGEERFTVGIALRPDEVGHDSLDSS